MTKNGQIIVDVKHAIKQPYAWPGGYPLFIALSDGAASCTACAKQEIRSIAFSTANDISDGWKAEAVDINWEDSELRCDHCSKRIESAYAE